MKAAFFRRGEVCTPETIDREVHPEEAAFIADHLRALLPTMPGRLLAAVACMYTTTPDQHFVIARHPEHERVTVACGFSGHGFKFVPVVGEILADLALDRDDEPSDRPVRPAPPGDDSCTARTVVPDMTSSTSPRTAAEVARVIAGVRDDQLTDPTPCAGTSVAAMLDHFVGLTVAFRLGAEKSPLAGGPSADADHLPADWRERLPRQLDALVAAWRAAGAWEGITEVAGVRMPAAAMGVVALNEVLVHGWDLAVATGQPYEVDPAAAQACLEFARAWPPARPRCATRCTDRSCRCPTTPRSFDRLLGQTGRDPAWKPS